MIEARALNKMDRVGGAGGKVVFKNYQKVSIFM